MRVFITGATGFVGLNIVEALLAASHEVVCYVRPNARQQYLERMPVKLICGDLADRRSLCDAMRGAEAVIHTAGNTSCRWRDIAALREANVDSTRAVLDAARATGVRRLVYTSTTSTVGSFDPFKRLADESVPLSGCRAKSPYAQTKAAAELLLTGTSHGPECIMLNPAEVIGPFDHSLQWGRIVLAVANGALPFVPPGTGTFAPARDVAAAHVAALTRGRPGERYILGGYSIAFDDFIALVGSVTGQPVAPLDTRPYLFQRWHAHLREWLPWLLPAPAVDAYRMRMFGGQHCFDDAKARAELGYTVRPLRVAIEECDAWYRAHGFLDGAQTVDVMSAAWRSV